MPRLGPPVVNPQKHPVVLRHQAASNNPMMVVFVLAMADPPFI
jgi:hypothetical protein